MSQIIKLVLVSVGILLLVGIAAMLILPIEPLGVELNKNLGDLKPTVNITLYAGETLNGEFGFGFTPDNIISPGPKLNLKYHDIVNLTLVNAGNIPHIFAIVSDLNENSPIIFSAQIGTTTRPVLSDSSQTVMFKIDQYGNFQYICDIPGHKELGMHGEVIIEQD